MANQTSPSDQPPAATIPWLSRFQGIALDPAHLKRAVAAASELARHVGHATDAAHAAGALAFGAEPAYFLRALNAPAHPDAHTNADAGDGR